MNDYVRLVELESSYQENTGNFGDDYGGSDDDAVPGAAAGGWWLGARQLGAW